MSIIQKHLDMGDKVLAILNPTSSKKNNFKIFPSIDILFCDINNYDDIIKEEKYDIFYHLAWQGGSNRSDFNTNINSALKSIDAVELASRLGCKLFVGAGSQAECGIQNEAISENTLCEPNSPFGISKLMSYHISKNKCNEMGLSFIWARILSVYGPYDGENTLVISSLRKMISGLKPEFTSGEQIWDFLYSSDAAELLHLIVSDPKAEGIYIIGSGSKTKLKHYIKIMTNKFNINSELLLNKIKSSSSSTNYLLGNVSRATNELGWKPKVNFSEGIDKTIEYCKKNNFQFLN